MSTQILGLNIKWNRLRRDEWGSYCVMQTNFTKQHVNDTQAMLAKVQLIADCADPIEDRM
jgi:hypothetical protein